MARLSIIILGISGLKWLTMNRSTPGLPVHHKLPEFTQTRVHRVGDAIQLGTKTIKKKKSTFLLFALSHETLIGFGSHAQVNSEDIINISKTVMIIFSKTSQVGLSPPQSRQNNSLTLVTLPSPITTDTRTKELLQVLHGKLYFKLVFECSYSPHYFLKDS